ncbi:AraC family transcriptional regulator [Cohnella hashimotonis]|uniref:AraC family transcriptional regulator n=1 Tax=Cohnella hashimotonis TaxID=2826895 RepID=A0ABT6TMQ4_9BACL|nr:AraC family transcriptional regulator [Cohnella hashimotonis]MDI4648020.1 AraC family transcriptional regulator [Cohnella hashimotonis]
MAIAEEGVRRYQRTQLRQLITVNRLITLYYLELGKNFRFGGEKHDFWELLYLDRGEIVAGADGVKHTLRQGEIIFHKPNEFHEFRAVEGLALNAIVITFDCGSAAMKLFENKVLRLGETERELLAQIIGEARHTFCFPFTYPLKRLERPKTGSEQLLRGYLEIFLIRLLRVMEENRASPAVLRPATLENGDERLYRDIVAFIRANLHDKLAVATICGAFFIGRARLQGVFRRLAGVPVMEYVTRMRMERAKAMIREESYNMSEIAVKLGYASLHYFSRAFKKEVGMSPSEYARTVQARMSGGDEAW